MELNVYTVPNTVRLLLMTGNLLSWAISTLRSCQHLRGLGKKSHIAVSNHVKLQRFPLRRSLK